MPTAAASSPARVRTYRNSKLYRALTRTLRVYNRRLLEGIHAKGFDDFSPAFPAMLSNLDLEGTHIGVLAARGGVTRQAAGQLLKQIEKCGYVTLDESPHDSRATIVRFTPRGRRLMKTIFGLVEQIEGEFAQMLDAGEFARVRTGLNVIADQIDPGGALGVGDAGES